MSKQTRKEAVIITGVMLRREGGSERGGGHAVVELEIDGQWLEVMREPIDANFSTIIEASGIYDIRDQRGVRFIENDDD